MYFSCFGKKSTKRSRVKGRFEQMRPLYNPPAAFKKGQRYHAVQRRKRATGDS